MAINISENTPNSALPNTSGIVYSPNGINFETLIFSDNELDEGNQVLSARAIKASIGSSTLGDFLEELKTTVDALPSNSSHVFSFTKEIDNSYSFNLSELPAGNITGTLPLSTIPPLPGTIIDSGVIGYDRIPNLFGEKITGGTIPLTVLPPEVFTTDNAKLNYLANAGGSPGYVTYNNVIGAYEIRNIQSEELPSVPFSLVTGDIPGARIISMSADKINAGTFAHERIPDLNANKITLGTLSIDVIPDIPGSKVTGGVPADTITTGVLPLGVIPNIPGTKILNINADSISSGTISADRLPANYVVNSLEFSSLVNIFEGTTAGGLRVDSSGVPDVGLQTSDIPNLDTSKITSGTFNTDRIPDLSTTYQPRTNSLNILSDANVRVYGAALLSHTNLREFSASVKHPNYVFTIDSNQVFTENVGSSFIYSNVDTAWGNNHVETLPTSLITIQFDCEIIVSVNLIFSQNIGANYSDKYYRLLGNITNNGSYTNRLFDLKGHFHKDSGTRFGLDISSPCVRVQAGAQLSISLFHKSAAPLNPGGYRSVFVKIINYL